MIPYGYCHCGCGGKTEPHKYGDSRKGITKGEPKKFIKGHRQGPIENKFWGKVAKGDGCWEWQGSINNSGYGQITVDGRCRTAHVFSWFLAHGEFPSLYVCHECDNPKCVRPDHLFLGTQSENMQDRKRKGRENIAKGGAHHAAKLSDEQVVRIRTLPAENYAKAAIEYGVTLKHIVRVANLKARTTISLS